MREREVVGGRGKMGGRKREEEKEENRENIKRKWKTKRV